MEDVQAPVVETPAAPIEAQAAPTTVVDKWNGEVDHLEKRPWWTKLDEQERADLKGGYASKATNLEKGYGTKFQALAEERKAWSVKEAALTKEVAELREESLFVKDIFGQGSPEAKDVDAKIAALRQEYEQKYGPIETELASLREYKTAAEKREAEAQEKVVAAEMARLDAEYKDIFETPDAAEMFARLVEAQVDDEDAAGIVRGKFKIEKPRLPGAALAASRGDSPAVQDRLNLRLNPKALVEQAAEMSSRQLGYR